MNPYLISDFEQVAIHFVGNKGNDEGLKLSEDCTELNSDLKNLLLTYFLTPFKSGELYTFYHESDLNLNEAFVYASRLFEQPDTLHEQSVHFAKHLYQSSMHPKINGGEFYTVYFKDAQIEGQFVDAIGLFKSERKDTFLKVEEAASLYEVSSEEGININKLDKGCLIFNYQKEKGYAVALVDQAGKGEEAVYWVDHFLKVNQRHDDYHHTQHVLSLCKNFITSDLPKAFEVTKADQADFLNKSIQFFKDKSSFDIDEFEQEVIAQPELIQRFQQYKSDYQELTETPIERHFDISNAAVKKQARVFKSVLKLDKNFHIYIHGNRELIEQGVEKDGRRYYKIYFEQES